VKTNLRFLKECIYDGTEDPTVFTLLLTSILIRNIRDHGNWNVSPKEKEVYKAARWLKPGSNAEDALCKRKSTIMHKNMLLRFVADFLSPTIVCTFQYAR
jgi:hypothetical protein